ncbi:MAG: hypothetical protein ACKVOY_03145, partial [Burkholderiaceae bacterium]
LGYYDQLQKKFEFNDINRLQTSNRGFEVTVEVTTIHYAPIFCQLVVSEPPLPGEIRLLVLLEYPLAYRLTANPCSPQIE